MVVGNDILARVLFLFTIVAAISLLALVVLPALAPPSQQSSQSLSVTESSSSAIKMQQKVEGIHVCQLGPHKKKDIVAIPETPHFIIIGAQKAGTSSLFTYLIQHPNVVPTRNFVKTQSTEVHFFDAHFPKKDDFTNSNDNDDEFYYCHARTKYADQFQVERLMERAPNGTLVPILGPLMNGRIVSFDKTPDYFLHARTFPRLIQNTCPWIHKIIVILRNPIDRAFSQYSIHPREHTFQEEILQELRIMQRTGLLSIPNNDSGDDDVSMEDGIIREDEDDTLLLFSNRMQRPAVSEEEEEITFQNNLSGEMYVRRGLYSIQLRQWLRMFSHPESLLVINYDEFDRDSEGVYQKVLAHVGLPPHDLPSKNDYSDRTNVGQYYGLPITPNVKKALETLYEPYNRELADLLGEEWRNVWSSTKHNNNQTTKCGR